MKMCSASLCFSYHNKRYDIFHYMLTTSCSYRINLSRIFHRFFLSEAKQSQTESVFHFNIYLFISFYFPKFCPYVRVGQPKIN